jgi:hypothetical protein
MKNLFNEAVIANAEAVKGGTYGTGYSVNYAYSGGHNVWSGQYNWGVSVKTPYVSWGGAWSWGWNYGGHRC